MQANPSAFAPACTHAVTNIHKYTCMYVHTYLYTYINTYVCIHTVDMHIHKHTYIYTYIGFLPDVDQIGGLAERRPQTTSKRYEMALPIKTFNIIRHINVLCILMLVLLLLVVAAFRHRDRSNLVYKTQQNGRKVDPRWLQDAPRSACYAARLH